MTPAATNRLSPISPLDILGGAAQSPLGANAPQGFELVLKNATAHRKQFTHPSSQSKFGSDSSDASPNSREDQAPVRDARSARSADKRRPAKSEDVREPKRRRESDRDENQARIHDQAAKPIETAPDAKTPGTSNDRQGPAAEAAVTDEQASAPQSDTARGEAPQDPAIVPLSALPGTIPVPVVDSPVPTGEAAATTVTAIDPEAGSEGNKILDRSASEGSQLLPTTPDNAQLAPLVAEKAGDSPTDQPAEVEHQDPPPEIVESSTDPVAVTDARSNGPSTEGQDNSHEPKEHVEDVQDSKPPGETSAPQLTPADLQGVQAQPSTTSQDQDAPQPKQSPESPATNKVSAPPVTGATNPAIRLPQNVLSRAEGHRSHAPVAVPVDSARFLSRVAKAFAAAQQRDGEIRLRLSPPELGSLRLQVSVQAGVMTARLETETEAARASLVNNLPALRERLAEQGIRVERFDIDLMQRPSTETPDRPHDPQQQHEPQPLHPSRTDRPGRSEPIVLPPSAGTWNGQGRLNVII